MECYVGLDVHSKASVFVIQEKCGRVIAQGEMPTTPAGFQRWQEAQRLGAGTPVALESGTVAFFVARELTALGCEPLVIDAREVRLKTHPGALRRGRKTNTRHRVSGPPCCIGIIRHNVVALARQAEQLINSADPTAIDRAAIQTDMSALGRFLITKKETDIASFKTPDLRNVLVTGPYFHDGSQETLWDVMDHYNKGDGLQNLYLDEDIQPLALTEEEIDDVVAFLASLTSADYAEQGRKELARQREIARTRRPQRDTPRAFGPKPPRQQRPSP